LPFQNYSNAGHSSLEAGYPHPAGTVRLVRPNANKTPPYQRTGQLLADFLEQRSHPNDENSHKVFLKKKKSSVDSLP
jgi:hypothetical protein